MMFFQAGKPALWCHRNRYFGRFGLIIMSLMIASCQTQSTRVAGDDLPKTYQQAQDYCQQYANQQAQIAMAKLRQELARGDGVNRMTGGCTGYGSTFSCTGISSLEYGLDRDGYRIYEAGPFAEAEIERLASPQIYYQKCMAKNGFK